MVEVLHEGADHRNDEDDLVVDAENNQRQVGQRFVDDHLRPVKAEVADPVQLLDAVMQFVKLPQPRHIVQQTVDIPLDEILRHEENDKLQPERRARHQSQRFRDGQAQLVEEAIQ